MTHRYRVRLSLWNSCSNAELRKGWQGGGKVLTPPEGRHRPCRGWPGRVL